MQSDAFLFAGRGQSSASTTDLRGYLSLPDQGEVGRAINHKKCSRLQEKHAIFFNSNNHFLCMRVYIFSYRGINVSVNWFYQFRLVSILRSTSSSNFGGGGGKKCVVDVQEFG
jgi:hypothetical protein